MGGRLSNRAQQQVRALKRITKGVCRRHKTLDELVTAIRKVAKTYPRTSEGAKELLEGLVVAEVGGVDETVLTEIRGDLAQRLLKRRAA